MSWVLGSDRSYRRLVLYMAFSLLALLLVHMIASSFWMFWISLTFIMQLLVAPFERKKSFRLFFRIFLQENLSSGFIEWLCRWELRVRNIYAIKLYVDPSGAVTLWPYFGRIILYFIIGKFLELCIFAGVIYLMLLPFASCSPTIYYLNTIDEDGSNSTQIEYVYQVCGSTAYFMTLSCEYCITPAFRPVYLDCFIDGNNRKEEAHYKEHRLLPVARYGEEMLNITVVNNPIDFYCIPIPSNHLNNREDSRLAYYNTSLLLFLWMI
ncbi:hypothetical protein THRCLA_10005 [Thraustotheca clavata]|uniref:Uncharacterized protein n=1 Tax=Thraustotheca clavata TaxID=74557 RepID=A0A1V9YT89_9STRA|nr:hypothetical protein THRCLA_10005 [Thraustotheca clavata]